MLPRDFKGRAAPYFLRSKKKCKRIPTRKRHKKQHAVHRPSKINLSNLGKGCTGAMDATKASWGVSPSLADPLGQDFPKKEVMYLLSSKRSHLRRQKGASPCFCLGIRPSPRVQPYCKFDQYILEGAMDGALSLISFSCGNAFVFVFATQKIRGCSPLKIPRQHF